MPCSVSREEMIAYEQMANIDRYGKNLNHEEMKKLVLNDLVNIINEKRDFSEAPDYVINWLMHNK